MVMEVENIFTKRNLLQIVEKKCIMVKGNIDSFKNGFENLVKMGIPSSLNDKGRILSSESYKKSLFVVRQNERKFKGMADSLRGKTIMDLLTHDFYLPWEIKNLFSNPPTYERYTKLDIAFKQMRSFQYPSRETWRFLIQLLIE
jgi:hypothetical protein